MKHVKVGKWKTVFKGHTFTIKQAKAILPDGRVETYERAFRPPSVEILALDSKNRLLLNYEYRTHVKKYLWRLPAGRVEEGETPKHAARRELMEEAGFNAKKMKLFYKTKPAASYAYVHYIYLATKLEPKKLNASEYEDITVVPVSLPKAYKMVQNEEISGRETMRSICKLYWNRKKFLK